MFGIGLPELIIIIIVALIVFGPKKLPDLAKSLGKGMAEFRKATDDFKSTVESDISSIENEIKDVKEDLYKGVPFGPGVSSHPGIPGPFETAPTEPQEASSDQVPEPSSFIEDIERGKVEITEISESAPPITAAAQIPAPPEEEGPPKVTKEPA